MVNGKITINEGELLDSNINRSPASYLMNPASERAKLVMDDTQFRLFTKV